MKTILVAAFVALVAGTAQAQQPEAKVSGFVESYNVVTDGVFTPSFTTYAEGPIKGKFGWSGWFWEEGKSWREGMLGLNVYPVEWIEFAVMVGAETDAKPLRGATFLWVSKGPLTFETTHEYGGSGYWYRYTGTYQVANWKVGVDSTQSIGIGPYIERKLGKFDLWGSYAVRGHGGSAGLRLNF